METETLDEDKLFEKFTTTGTQCHINEDNFGRKNIIDIIKTEEILFGWTGMSKFDIVTAIEESLDAVWPLTERKKIDIDAKSLIILFFIKIKTNLPFVVIGTLFHKNRHTISNYFYYILPIFRQALGGALYWPCTEEIRANFPVSFLPFPSTRIMLGSFEIKIPNLKCTTCKAEYETGAEIVTCAETLKFMIGVTPAGIICFISKAYCGNLTDAEIFIEENILEKYAFQFNVDSIMVAKGFQIQEQCRTAGISIIRPHNDPAAGSEFNTKLSKALAFLQRSISRVRNNTIIAQKIEGNLIPYMDDIVYNVCCMVNLSFPNKSYTRF